MKRKRNIIIDCDPGIDDVLAILLALANQDKLNILGVTTVAGNQTLEKVTLNLRKLYTYLGVKTETASGSTKPLIRQLRVGTVHGETGLGDFKFPEPQIELDSTNAVTFMYDKIMKSKEKVTLVPIGPLTNIGLLLSTFPEVKEKIELISLMGGSIFAGNITSKAEFNIYVDPEAAKIVFNSEVPIVMSGLEVTHKACINKSEIKDLINSNGKVSKMCGEIINYYFKLEKVTEDKMTPIHDACSIMYLLYPEIFEYKYMQIDVDCSEGYNRGMTVADTRDWIKYDNYNTKVLLNVDRDVFSKILLDAIYRLDNL